MKNLKLAGLLAISVFSSASFAASETFQATVNAINDSAIAQTTALHFGAIQPSVASVCTMDNAGAVTGNCDAANGNIALGVVTVSGLVAATPLNVTITGSSGSNVTFVSTVDILNAAGTHNAIADGSTTAEPVNGTGDDLTLNVYGSMTVDTALTPGQSYTADYVVDVTFQ